MKSLNAQREKRDFQMNNFVLDTFCELHSKRKEYSLILQGHTIEWKIYQQSKLAKLSLQ
jgi:hypothetical protein